MLQSSRSTHRLMKLLTLSLILAVSLAWAGQRAHAATIVVDTTADDDVVNGNCTLREAMIAARDNVAKDGCLTGGSLDVINFNINAGTDPGCSGSVCTIQPLTQLPSLDNLGYITIDGYSQPGAAAATASTEATILIVIDGSLSINPYGIYIQSPGNLVQGLAIHQFDTGIVIGGLASTGNAVRGCYIGTDSGGTLDLGNTNEGIWVSSTGADNIIGGTIPAHRNVISGNNYGVNISGSSAGTTVSGNYIGTSADGLASIENGTGVYLQGDANHNTIGGAAAGAGNIVSGNKYDGITINGGFTDPHDITIENNWIGVDVTGAVALANAGNGVQILNGAYGNIIGPNNVISGNAQNGILIWTDGTDGNGIKGNFIGTDSTGTSAIPNASFNGGIFIQGAAQGNVIGGDTPAERNVISGNTGLGVRISGEGTDFTVVSGNYIGLDVTGSSSLPNGFEGVGIVNDAANTTIGGTTSGEGNVIADSYSAVLIQTGANNNTVSANLLGTDASGLVAMGVGTGVSINGGAHDNTIGGVTFAERNVISGNGGYGVRINGSGTDRNQVMRNYIGVDITGTGALPNGTSSGMRIENGAQSNIIGPGNIIANHATEGIYIYGVDTDFNTITQNRIFANTNWNIAVATDGANEGILAPTVSSVSLSPPSVSGTSCNNCMIEIYTSLSSIPSAGRSYLGTGTADGSGNWTVMTPGLHGPYLTATATHASMGTSQFSGALFTTIQALYLPLIMR